MLTEDGSPGPSVSSTAAPWERYSVTIAHRLGTIAACDAVAVLDDGKLREFAAPSSTPRRRGLELLRPVMQPQARAPSSPRAARRADERRANGRAPRIIAISVFSALLLAARRAFWKRFLDRPV